MILYMVGLLFVSALLGGVWFSRHLLARANEEDAVLIERAVRRKSEIRALPVTEAKQRALALINDPFTFVTVNATQASADESEDLAPELRELLGRYELIQKLGSEAHVTGQGIGPVPSLPPFLQIGTDFDATLVLVKPHEEGVYITDGSDTAEELDEPDYPTIYHWLIAKGTS